MPLFKVWSTEKKKCVIASSLDNLIASGRQKLGLKEGAVSVFLEDGTEIDENDILQELSPGTVIYLLNEDDKKPWELQEIEILHESHVRELDEPLSPAVGSESSGETHTSSLNLPAIQEQLLLPWPQQFRVPASQFSSELNAALVSGNLTWRVKSELLGHLSREISKYTFKPSVAQRDEVARELISLFPTLKSNIGEGHHGWSQKIYDKMCEENKKRNGIKKRPASHGGVKNVKLPRRGEVNFTPSLNVDPEVELASKHLLAEEAQKPLESRDSKLIEENMMATFSDRRELVAQKILVTELKQEYPILFSELGVKTDFKLLNGFELEPRFFQRLHECAEKVREEAILQKAKKSCKNTNFLTEILEGETHSDVTALRLLPILLSDRDQSFLYRLYEFETAPEVLKTSGPETPHVAVLGDFNDHCLCFIVIENDLVFSVHGFVKAIMLMFAMYYCCNMEYASEVVRTLKFFQVYLLEMAQSTKLPSKLLTFCSKMP